jgi:fatty-acyl-CoA synthase
MKRIAPQADWTAKWAEYQPEKIAFKEAETGKTLTYQQLNTKAIGLGLLLLKKGLKKGDRIAVLAENCLTYNILFAAAQKTGLILVPLNYRLASPEIDFLLKSAGPKMVVLEQKFENLIQGAASFSSISHQWKLEELTTILDTIEAGASLPPVDIFEDDPIFILFTSGTTGFPKGAIYTHKMLFWNSINTAMSLIVNTESRTVNCMPPFHTGGWNVLMTPFWHHGGYTCLTKKFEPDLVLKAFGRGEGDHIYGCAHYFKNAGRAS